MTTTTAEHTVKVGDFFVSSWGYDQTNIDFYRVMGISASGKSVRVQQWQSTTRATEGGYQDWCAPGLGPRCGGWVRDETGGSRYDPTVEYPILTRRLRDYGGRPCFSVNSYSSANLWEGEPHYATAAGYGH